MCPWSLAWASSIPVLGLESVCPRKGCPWPLASDFFCVLGLGLEPCVLNSTSVNQICNSRALAIIVIATLQYCQLRCLSATKLQKLCKICSFPAPLSPHEISLLSINESRLVVAVDFMCCKFFSYFTGLSWLRGSGSLVGHCCLWDENVQAMIG